MKKASNILFLLLITAFGVWGFTTINADKFPVSEPVAANDEVQEIEWITIEEAMKRHEKEPRYWVVDIYTDWCGWCKKMDASTFKDPHVTELINEHYYAVKFDAEAKRDIQVGDKVYKFVASGRRGYHELAAQLLNGKMSYPSIAYMSKEGGLIQTIAGYKTAQDIHPILQYFGTGTYKATSWEDFQKTYTSPYAQK